MGDIHSTGVGNQHFFLDGSGTLDANVTGSWNSLIKEGTGTWNLNRAIADNTFYSLGVQEGTLVLGNSFTLNGGVNDIRNGATLDLGTHALTTSAQSILYSGATIKTSLGAGGYGQINAGIFDVRGNVTVIPSGIDAGTYALIGRGLDPADYSNFKSSNNLQTMSSLFASYTMASISDKLNITVAPSTDDELAQQGLNPDDVHAIQDAFKNDSTSMDKLTAMDAAEAKKALNEAHAEPIQGAVAAVLNAEHAARGIIAGRLLAARSAAYASTAGSGLSSGSDELQGWKVWGQGFGSTASESAHGGSNGFDAKTAGLTFGIDKAYAEDLRLGLAYTYIYTNVDSKGSTNTNKVNSNLLTFYSEKLFDEAMYLDVHTSLGLNQYDTKRYMTILGLQAKADFDGMTFNIGGEFGKSYQLSDPMVITPYFGLDYSYISTDSYEESGAGSSNLIVDNTNNNIFASALGTRIAATYGAWTPGAHVAWIRDWTNEKIGSTGRFATSGAALSSTAISPEADKVNLGFTLGWQATDVCAVDFTFDYLGSEHMDSFGGAARISYEF